MMKIVALIAMGVASADAVRVGKSRIGSAPVLQHDLLEQNLHVEKRSPSEPAKLITKEATMTIYMFRHGQSKWNAWKNWGGWFWHHCKIFGSWADAELTAKGVDDALAIRDWFAKPEQKELRDKALAGKVMFDASNLSRAIDTLMIGAQDVLEDMKLTVADQQTEILVPDDNLAKKLDKIHHYSKPYVMSCLQETTRGADASLTGKRRAGNIGTYKDGKKPPMPLPGAATKQQGIEQQRIENIYQFHQDKDIGNNPVNDRVNEEKIKERIVDFLNFSFEHQSEDEIDTVFAAGHSHQILELMTRLAKTTEMDNFWQGLEKDSQKLGNGNGAKITITKRAGCDGNNFGDYIIEGIEYIDPH
jgi:bisphosphoglycerate-dependent phosphoglycerate mutase